MVFTIVNDECCSFGDLYERADLVCDGASLGTQLECIAVLQIAKGLWSEELTRIEYLLYVIILRFRISDFHLAFFRQSDDLLTPLVVAQILELIYRKGIIKLMR